MRKPVVKVGEKWEVLQGRVHGLITLTNFQITPMMEDVYAICTAGQEKAGELYRELNAFLKAHLQRIEAELRQSVDEEFLGDYFVHWERYRQGAGYLKTPFRHLNKGWIHKHANPIPRSIRDPPVCEVTELALYLWVKYVYTPLKERLLDLVMKEIKIARDEGGTAREEAKGIIDSILQITDLDKDHPNVSLYEEDFEKPFLQITAAYYMREMAACASNPLPQFMMEAEKRLNAEEMRSRYLLDGTSVENLQKTLVNVIIEKNEGLFFPNIRPMIKNVDELFQKQVVLEKGKEGPESEDLRRLFRLLSKSPTFFASFQDEAQLEFQEIGMRDVARLSQSKPDPVAFVEVLLKAYKRTQKIVSNIFSDSEILMDRLKQAFKEVVNDCPGYGPHASEFFAKYCDRLLRVGQKDINTSDVDAQIAEVSSLFPLLDEKDVFQDHYIHLLSKRVLSWSSISDDSERAILVPLKEAFGYRFFSKIHKMFNDLNVSEGLTRNFLQKNDVGMDFDVVVLTSGCWRVSYQPCESYICPLQEKVAAAFTKYYCGMHSTRKLVWFHHLSRCEITTNFGHKMGHPIKYQIIVTAGQYVVLRHFGNEEKTTGKNLSLLGIPKEELATILKSLLIARLIKKDPKNAEFQLTDRYILNTSVSFKTKKVNIAKLMETKSKKKEDGEKVEKNTIASRRFVVEAVIVRIMKTRKELSHTLLVQAVIEQMRKQFNVPVPLIKKCIESLLEKQYIERESDDQNVYRYLA